jgi:hypothetical protein
VVVPDLELETCAIVRRRHSEDRGREFERSIMLSRQLEGIAKAKAEGKYRGGIVACESSKVSTAPM